ncbi:MAG: hypothetical protein MUE36_03105 [Acidimicrobiales bacterium]|jgi:hypothetical protein|nr:hypothetical protein [Acidimicrobiales bacterium]
MDARQLGIGIVATGALAQVTGLGLDAWLHSSADRDIDGALALENVGHVLFVGGLVAVVVGAVLALVGPRLYAPTANAGPGRRLAQFGAPAAAVLLVVAGLSGASSSSLTGTTEASSASGTAGDGHTDHDHEAEPVRCDLGMNTAAYYRGAVEAGMDLAGGGDGHDHAEPGPVGGLGETAAAPAGDAGGGHDGHDGPQAWTPITDPATCAQLETELDQAAAVAARYPTPVEAKAAGYVMVTTYIPEIASHWMNFAHVDDEFVIDQPEMLLYDGTGDDATMVGLSYYLLSDGEPSPDQTFVGGNVEFHQHVGLCVKGTLVVGGSGTSAEECAARGGRKGGGSNAWMAHAWVVPGCESPWGVFSASNPKLTAELGRASGRGAPCSGSGATYDDTPGLPAELASLVAGAPPA